MNPHVVEHLQEDSFTPTPTNTMFPSVLFFLQPQLWPLDGTLLEREGAESSESSGVSRFDVILASDVLYNSRLPPFRTIGFGKSLIAIDFVI